MNILEHLKTQTKDTYNWVNILIENIPFDKWDYIPDNLETNVTWQVGHLIMSFYYHTIMVITGHQIDIINEIPLQNYNLMFTKSKPENCVGKVPPPSLIIQLETVQRKSLEIIDLLSPNELQEKLEHTQTPHPIAKNKYEALNWNIKHTMWHCGQLGILKRIIHQSLDFGLRTNE